MQIEKKKEPQKYDGSFVQEFAWYSITPPVNYMLIYDFYWIVFEVQAWMSYKNLNKSTKTYFY